jgi:predicted RNA methylase
MPSLEDHLPADLQVKASVHFTPVGLARRIAAMLAPEPGAVVLDVGAGPGMFCVAAALAARKSRFVGAEWRERLVEVARTLARRYELDNVSFVHADVLELDWSAYDSFYLYNPFAEHVMESPFLLDRDVRLDRARFTHYVRGVQERLALAPLGTRVATYHGFGGDVPPGYWLSSTHAYGTDRVELWVKTR